MRESDIPLTAVSTQKGMLWEWLVMPQGLANAPATSSSLVGNGSYLIDPMHTRTFMTSLSIVVLWTAGQMSIIVLKIYKRCSSACVRSNKFDANQSKCILDADAILFLGCSLLCEAFERIPIFWKLCLIIRFRITKMNNVSGLAVPIFFTKV